MRDPCPYCGLPGIALSRFDAWTREIVRDVKEHACYGWAPKEILPSEPTDTSFIREAWNTEEGLRLWRER